MKMKTFTVIALMVLLAAMMFGCGGGQVSSGGTSAVKIAIAGLAKGAAHSGLSAQSATVANVQFFISAPDMETITRSVVVSGDTITESFTVPNGSNRHFLVVALASDNTTALSQGDAFADLNGTPKDVNIVMGVDISGEWTVTTAGQGGRTDTDFVTFAQTGNSLSAAIIPSQGSASGSGTSIGNDVQMTITGSSCGNALNASFVGTIFADGSLGGTFTQTGGCGNDSGTWHAVRGHIVPQFSISGAWTVFHTTQGGTEQGPGFAMFSQTGSSLSFTLIDEGNGTAKTGSGTISGNNIQLNFANTDKCNNPATASLTGTISSDGNTMSGNYTNGTGSCGETGTWRATRAQPPAADISGSWSAFHAQQGGTEQGPDCVTIAQTGSFFTLSGALNGSGILSGSGVQMIFVVNDTTCRNVTHLAGTLSPNGNSLSGTYGAVSNCSTSVESGTWRAAKGACTTPQPPSQGTVSGTVTDTLGAPLAGVDVGLFQQDLLLASGTTDSSGNYSLTAPAGSGYSIVFSKSGYTTITKGNIAVNANATTTVGAVMTTVLQAGQTRVVLTWGATPDDLDSHLTGPILDSSQRFHVYYGEDCLPQGSCSIDNNGNRIPGPNTYALLDHDDTSSFGPETTTIVHQLGGVYRFSVHDFTNSDSASSLALSNSGAQVQVFQGNSLVQTFSIRTNQVGTLWTVFELNGNQITSIDTMSNQSDPIVIQSASQRASLKKTGKKLR
jgi:hypothetical protein